VQANAPAPLYRVEWCTSELNPRRNHVPKTESSMQDDRGVRRVFTLSWAYTLFQRLVGASHARRWVSERFWRARSGQKVVDVGCGPANTVHLLPPGVRYVGFDISEAYIADARSRYDGDTDKTFLVGAAEDFVENLPPQMRDADLVIMNGLLHHLEDDEALTALKLARLSLSPGGRLICLEGCFLLSQSPIARWVLKQDRGRNVRTEPEWKALVARVFDRSETYILTGLLRIPYTLIVIEARL
jgi:SAM-dependent methyltransferase